MKTKNNLMQNRGTRWIFGGVPLIVMLFVMMFMLGRPAFAQYSLTNATLITITNDTSASGEAINGYPSSVTVPANLLGGGTNLGSLEKVTVTINGFTHAYPNDVVMLLIAPNNNAVVLMGNDGGGVGKTNLTLTFDDVFAGAQTLATATALASGTNKTGNNAAIGTNFPSLPPGVTFTNNLVGLSNSLTPLQSVGASYVTNYTGTWSLYVLDDSQPNTGSIASWSLNLYVRPSVVVTNSTVTLAENTSTSIYFTVSDANSNTTLTPTIILTGLPAGNGNTGYTNASGKYRDFISNVIPADFTFTPANPTNGTNRLTITPNPNLYGNASFGIVLTDSSLATASNTTPIQLTVSHVVLGPKITVANATITTTNGLVTAPNLVSLISMDGNPGLSMTFSVTATNLGNVGVNSNVFTNNLGLTPIVGITNQFNCSIDPNGLAMGTNYLNFIATDTAASLSATQLVTVVVVPWTNAANGLGPLVYANTNSLITTFGNTNSSQITLPSLTNFGPMGKVTVSLLGLTNIIPTNLSLWLQAPDGTMVTLLTNNASAIVTPSTYAEVTFADPGGFTNDQVSNSLPAAGTPTNLLTNYVLQACGVTNAFAAALSGRLPTNASGNVWTLWTTNGANSGTASVGISGGWVLAIYPEPVAQELAQTNFITMPELFTTNVVFVTVDTVGIQNAKPTVTLTPATTTNYNSNAMVTVSVNSPTSATINGITYTVGGTNINGTNYQPTSCL